MNGVSNNQSPKPETIALVNHLTEQNLDARGLMDLLSNSRGFGNVVVDVGNWEYYVDEQIQKLWANLSWEVRVGVYLATSRLTYC